MGHLCIRLKDGGEIPSSPRQLVSAYVLLEQERFG
jgi:hypothetical protein